VSDETTTMTAAKLQDALRDLLLELLDARDDEADDEVAELAGHLEDVATVYTFGEAALLTRDNGLVIECGDGSAFQLTIVRSA
jgi:hypothetical protein